VWESAALVVAVADDGCSEWLRLGELPRKEGGRKEGGRKEGGRKEGGRKEEKEDEQHGGGEDEQQEGKKLSCGAALAMIPDPHSLLVLDATVLYPIGVWGYWRMYYYQQRHQQQHYRHHAGGDDDDHVVAVVVAVLMPLVSPPLSVLASLWGLFYLLFTPLFSR
jgi:hypothetical protein